MRREQRRRSSGWLAWLVGGAGEERELDEAEEAVERERRGLDRGMAGLGVGRAEIDGEALNGREKRNGRGRFALVWGLMRAVRRMMVDVAVLGMMGALALLIVRGWRGRLGRRLRDRYRRFIRQ